MESGRDISTFDYSLWKSAPKIKLVWLCRRRHVVGPRLPHTVVLRKVCVNTDLPDVLVVKM